MKAKLYKTDGTEVEIEPANGTDFDFTELRNYVDGFFQLIRISDGWLICNEDGLSLGLEPNAAATEIYWMNYKTTDSIVGDVVVCGFEMVK